MEDILSINSICRKYNINFIYALNWGLTGYLFNDFGKEYHIYDLNGEKN